MEIVELARELPELRPLITMLRDRRTKNNRFKDLLRFYGSRAAQYVLSKEPMGRKSILTGNDAFYDGWRLRDSYAVISILRAGEPMAQGIEQTLQEYDLPVSTGYIGAKRIDQEKIFSRVGGKPVWNFGYEINYRGLPNLKGAVALVSDPMLASGGTLIESTPPIVQGRPLRLYYVSLISSQYGIDRLMEFLGRELPNSLYESVVIVTGEIDRGGIDRTGLNKKGFIVPGLGDAGDRASSR